jgi:CheY-like chemotaxis protein
MRGIFLTTDLFFGSQVTSAAKAAGGEVTLAPSSEQLLAQARSGEAPAQVVLDLAAVGDEVSAVVANLRKEFPELTIIGYASHVIQSRLEAAREAGCDRVLTRGQFSREIPTLFADGN